MMNIHVIVNVGVLQAVVVLISMSAGVCGPVSAASCRHAGCSLPLWLTWHSHGLHCLPLQGNTSLVLSVVLRVCF